MYYMKEITVTDVLELFIFSTGGIIVTCLYNYVINISLLLTHAIVLFVPITIMSVNSYLSPPIKLNMLLHQIYLPSC